jgi:hypothetical protein
MSALITITTKKERPTRRGPRRAKAISESEGRTTDAPFHSAP